MPPGRTRGLPILGGVSFQRSRDEEPVGGQGGTVDFRPSNRTNVVATGTLACPQCDAPVSPGGRPLAPGEPMRCPVCDHGGRVRDFLSLATPARPARVRVVVRGLDVRVRRD